MRSVSLASMVVVALCVVAARASADTVDSSAGGSAVAAVVQVSALSKHGASDALLIPVTAGVMRGLGQGSHRQSYAAVRVGPYYGKVDDNLGGPDESRIGGCANVALGLVIDRKYLLEARYDWFTRLAGNNFNGLTSTVGVKVAEFSR